MKQKMQRQVVVAFGVIVAVLGLQSARADLGATAPVRESAISVTPLGRPLELALKRYPLPGAAPVLILHGIAQNDRGWDSTVERYSFARQLHAAGFDVWLGNFRGAGTEGFRSEAPWGPHRWTVEDYAAYDVPALVRRVLMRTGKRPFVIAHSLGAWATEGYLAGLVRMPDGRFRPTPALGRFRQTMEIRGFVSVAGVHSLWWPKSLERAVQDPVRSVDDFYQSNYLLELLAGRGEIFRFTPLLPSLPVDWIDDVLFLPLDRIPFVGARLRRLYTRVQDELIETPIASMFYYAPGIDPEVVRLHTRDGLHELGPLLTEQLANGVRERAPLTHYSWGGRPASAFDYASVRGAITVPTLFVAGTKDRLANASMIYEDGYKRYGSSDKQYRALEAGHLDIQAGRRMPDEVAAPVVAWMRARE